MNFDGVKAAVELVAEYEMLDSKRRYITAFLTDVVRVVVTESRAPGETARGVEFTSEKAIIEAVVKARLHDITNKLYSLGVYPPTEESKDNGND